MNPSFKMSEPKSREYKLHRTCLSKGTQVYAVRCDLSLVVFHRYFHWYQSAYNNIGSQEVCCVLFCIGISRSPTAVKKAVIKYFKNGCEAHSLMRLSITAIVSILMMDIQLYI